MMMIGRSAKLHSNCKPGKPVTPSADESRSVIEGEMDIPTGLNRGE